MAEPRQPTVQSRRPPPFHEVVVATDFTPGAEEACARASYLPAVRGGRISVVHVLPERFRDDSGPAVAQAAAAALAKAAAALAQARTGQGMEPVPVTATILRGTPFVEINRHARVIGAELVVLGRHGQRTLRDRFIGSTAERVLRSGDRPVLVVARPAQGPYLRPVVAVDLEKAAPAVVETALRALSPDVHEVTLFHAYHVPFEDLVTSPSASASTAARRAYQQRAAEGLTALQEVFSDRDITWRTVLLRGDARMAIMAEAVEHRADLLVLGTHRRTRLAHTLLGSVAEWVIRTAATDVLVARNGQSALTPP